MFQILSYYILEIRYVFSVHECLKIIHEGPFSEIRYVFSIHERLKIIHERPFAEIRYVFSIHEGLKIIHEPPFSKIATFFPSVLVRYFIQTAESSDWTFVIIEAALLYFLFWYKFLHKSVKPVKQTQNPEPSTKKFIEMKMQSNLSGNGNPILLVPGGLTGWDSWEPHTKILSENHTVIRVQLLSVQYGLENRNLPPDYSVITESEALAKTLDSLGCTTPIDIVGWSYGAFTALQYALDHPERVRSLTLIEPTAMWLLRSAGKFDESAQKEVDFVLSLRGDITEDMLAEALKHSGMVKPDQSPRELPQWSKWGSFRQSLRNSHAIVTYKDDLKRLQNIQVPVLLVKGTGSSPVIHKITDVLAENLPHSRIVEFPGGHAPHIVSMNDFLTELEKFQNDPGIKIEPLPIIEMQHQHKL